MIKKRYAILLFGNVGDPVFPTISKLKIRHRSLAFVFLYSVLVGWGMIITDKYRMKKSLSMMMLLVFSIALHAQQDVTRFLGIPVDGTRAEMVRKLKEKGFRSKVGYSDTLFGEFNGKHVGVSVVTHKDKVWRVFVTDESATHDEAQLRLRFNNLCDQFSGNPNYYPFYLDQSIPEDEDILYKMVVDKKRYAATFFQKTSGVEDYNKRVWFTILSVFGEYRIVLFYDNLHNEAKGEDL